MRRPLTFRPAVAPPAPAAATPETPAELLRQAMQLLLTAERGRAVLTVESGHETIRLGMALLPVPAFRAIGAHLVAALEQLEGVRT